MNDIVPAIIPDSLDYIREQMSLVRGLVPMVQIDVEDGKYTDSITWPYNKGDEEEFSHIVSEENGMPYWDELEFGVDMMIENSPEEVEKWIHAGASRVILHIESTKDITSCIEKAKELGTDVALALKPSTPTDKLEPLLGDVSSVQFMGSDHLGHHGVGLDESVVEKIKDFHKRHPEIVIAIDIGVSQETIPTLKEAGVTRFASGSAVFGAEDIKSEIKLLRSL